HNLAQKCPLFAENKFVVFREIEVGDALRVVVQPRAISLVGRKAFERDQRERNVVCSLMRHEIADQVASASRDNGEPALRILLELRALERIKLITDETGDSHSESPLAVANSNLISCTTSMLRLSSKHESRTRYRHGRLARGRSSPRQHPDCADDRPGADRERTCPGGRNNPADRKFPSCEARSRRTD